MPVSKDKSKQAKYIQQQRHTNNSVVIPQLSKQKLSARKRFEKEPEKWLKKMLPEVYPLPFGEPHKKLIHKAITAIEQKGNFSIALPRSSGKTSLLKGLLLYALLTGKARFVVLVNQSQPVSKRALKDLLAWLMHGEKLAEYYPEICLPFKASKGSPQRIKNLWEQDTGEQFLAKLEAEQLILPSTKTNNNRASGSIIVTSSITGQLRGLQQVLPDGTVLRPDTVLIDDVQKTKGSYSRTQIDSIINIVKSDIMGLGGGNKGLSILFSCTVIAQDDVSTYFLNSPDWRGEKIPMITSWGNLEEWDKYNEIRLAGLEKEDNGKSANKYYLENREILDKGFSVSWEHRKLPNEISAIQSAMHRYYIAGKNAFFSEYQNEPLEVDNPLTKVTPEDVGKALNHLPRGKAPDTDFILTCMIDINQRNGLNWLVLSGDNRGACHILDYGRYPERGLFIQPKDKPREDSIIYNAVIELVTKITANNYQTESGAPLLWSSFAIDGNYKTAVIERAVLYLRKSLKINLFSSRSRSPKFYRQYKNARNKIPEAHCWINQRRVPETVYNADYWQELAQARLLATPEDANSISLFGSKAEKHKRFADEITSQQLLERVEGNTFTLYNWTIPNGANDLLDCLKGALAQYTLVRGGNYLEQTKTTAKENITIKKGIVEPVENNSNQDKIAKLKQLLELKKQKQVRRATNKRR